MSNNLKEIEEPSEGTKLGTYLRVLYCLGYGQGYEDGASKSEMNSNHNKDDYVARIYSDILTLINQKEKEAEIRGLENLLDGSAEGATFICESAGIAVCDHNWSLCNVVRDRIKQLKEELKGGKD